MDMYVKVKYVQDYIYHHFSVVTCQKMHNAFDIKPRFNKQ